jgi:hypothetical protein
MLKALYTRKMKNAILNLRLPDVYDKIAKKGGEYENEGIAPGGAEADRLRQYAAGPCGCHAGDAPVFPCFPGI